MALATQERMQEYLAHLVERDNTGKFVDVEADGTREQLWEQVLPHLEKIKKHLFLNTIPNNKLEVGIKD
jgi:hypothetical protein